MMDYKFEFDKYNSNSLRVFKAGKLYHVIACPPTEKGCDIINFSNKLRKGYTFDFDGLIVMTTKDSRKLYYKGDLVAETKLKTIKSMNLSEKYLTIKQFTESPEGENWSAYEYEAVSLEHAKKYGMICALETILQHGDNNAKQKAVKQLQEIAQEENIDMEI